MGYATVANCLHRHAVLCSIWKISCKSKRTSRISLSIWLSTVRTLLLMLRAWVHSGIRSQRNLRNLPEESRSSWRYWILYVWSWSDVESCWGNARRSWRSGTRTWCSITSEDNSQKRTNRSEQWPERLHINTEREIWKAVMLLQISLFFTIIS